MSENVIERESVGERGSDSKSERDRKRDIVCVFVREEDTEGQRGKEKEEAREREDQRDRERDRELETLKVQKTEKQRDGETERQDTQNIHTRTRFLFP